MEMLRNHPTHDQVALYGSWVIYDLIDASSPSSRSSVRSALIGLGAEEAVRNCCENIWKSSALSRLEEEEEDDFFNKQTESG